MRARFLGRGMCVARVPGSLHRGLSLHRLDRGSYYHCIGLIRKKKMQSNLTSMICLVLIMIVLLMTIFIQ